MVEGVYLYFTWFAEVVWSIEYRSKRDGSAVVWLIGNSGGGIWGIFSARDKVRVGD